MYIKNIQNIIYFKVVQNIWKCVQIVENKCLK